MRGGNVLAVNVPVVSFTRPPAEINAFYREVLRRIGELPGVERVALGTAVPWRDPGFFAAQFTVEGYSKANGEEDPRAQFRSRLVRASSPRSACRSWPAATSTRATGRTPKRS